MSIKKVVKAKFKPVARKVAPMAAKALLAKYGLKYAPSAPTTGQKESGKK